MHLGYWFATGRDQNKFQGQNEVGRAHAAVVSLRALGQIVRG